MVLITIVTGAYKPTYNWGASHCRDPLFVMWEKQSHDGSMILLYMVLHGSHQYTPVMLAYIPAPWIRHGNNKPPMTGNVFFYHPFYDNYHQDNHNTVDGCEILHQLVDGQNPLITPMTFTTLHSYLTVAMYVQDFATIHCM